MKKKLLKRKPTVSRAAVRVLHIGLPIVLCQLLIMTAFLIFGEHENGIYAFRQYCRMLEYIALDITLLFGGALLFEIAERDVGCG